MTSIPMLTAGPNYIYQMDAEAFLRMQTTGSVDLIVTSPPYNIRNSTGGGFHSTENRPGKWRAQLRDGYDLNTDDMPHEQYVAWQRRCLTEMMRVIPDTGAIFYNHKWRVQDGLLQDRADIVAGFPVRQIIIWQRAGSVNFNDGYFLPTYEVIYLIAKPKFKLKKGANGLGDVWFVPQESDTPHPAPFPIHIPLRCIQSTEAQTVCDPFMGWGTTALAARRLKRKYIGCDISGRYVCMANERLAKPFDVPMFEELTA